MSSERRIPRPEDALHAFRHLGTPVEDDEVAKATREQIVPEVARTIQAMLARRSVRRRRMALMLVAALATFVLAGLHGYRAMLADNAERVPVLRARAAIGPTELRAAPDSVSVSRHGRRIANGSTRFELQPGDEISSSSASTATLAFSGGARTELSAKTQLALARVEPSERRLWLSSGRIEVTVPKLAPGSGFVVATPQAEVRVRGTQFSVEVLRNPASGRGITRVGVTHGLVEVTSLGTKVLLGAGEHWSSPGGNSVTRAPAPLDSAENRSAPADTPVSAATALHAERPAPERAPRRSNEAEPVRGRALAKQNGLLESAITAKKRGDDARAVRLLDELLRRHADSPLAESAQVERFRALRRLGRHAEAAREARRYLATHGEGFARDEAREVVLEPTERAGAPRATEQTP